MRKWQDSGSGTILLRNMHEDKPKRKKKVDEAAVKERNEKRKICLECNNETCSGNCRRVRTK